MRSGLSSCPDLIQFLWFPLCFASYNHLLPACYHRRSLPSNLVRQWWYFPVEHAWLWLNLPQFNVVKSRYLYHFRNSEEGQEKSYEFRVCRWNWEGLKHKCDRNCLFWPKSCMTLSVRAHVNVLTSSPEGKCESNPKSVWCAQQKSFGLSLSAWKPVHFAKGCVNCFTWPGHWFWRCKRLVIYFEFVLGVQWRVLRIGIWLRLFVLKNNPLSCFLMCSWFSSRFYATSVLSLCCLRESDPE